MSEADIEAVLREFDPIHRQIAQPEGKDAIVVTGASAESGSDTARDDSLTIAFLCMLADRMLSAGHGFPDVEKYSWISAARHYRNSFEASCQGDIVNLLICLWEHQGYLCDKLIIARNEHTGGFHIETYECANAYFACISYQFSNLINRYSLLNHYLIEIGEKAEQLQCLTPTNEIGGQAIERAMRSKWSEICPHLDSFLSIIAKASNYQASEVLLDRHVTEAMEQFYTSEKYVHLRDAKKLLTGPFYLPAEVMWIMYSDQVTHFTLAHELIHIQKGDIRRPGRAFVEEMLADMGAADLLAYMTTSTAKRGGYQPSIANIIMGPIIFFTLSKVFAYFDNFEEKYVGKKLSEASYIEAKKEELNLLQRSAYVARFVVEGGWVTDPRGAPFWNITGELRLIEIALRRRLWELSGVPLSMHVETEISLLQGTIQDWKLKTERDVTNSRQAQKGSKR